MDGRSSARTLCALAALTGLATWTYGETLGQCDGVGDVIYVQDWSMLLCDRTGRRIGAGNICRESLRNSAGHNQGRLIFDAGGSSLLKPEWHFPELCLPGTRAEGQRDPWKCHCTNNNIWDCFQSEDHFNQRSVLGGDSSSNRGGARGHDRNSTSQSQKALAPQEQKKEFWYCDQHGAKHVLLNCIQEKPVKSTREIKKYDTPGFVVKECLPGTFGVMGASRTE